MLISGLQGFLTLLTAPNRPQERVVLVSLGEAMRAVGLTYIIQEKTGSKAAIARIRSR